MNSPSCKKPVCESCGKKEAQEPHPCPYAQDIHDDNETLCTCCEDCEYECAQDI